MPQFKFDGPDGPESHDVEKGPNGLLRWHLAEARQIQRVADLTIQEFQSAIFSLDATALTALVQVLWKRDGRVVKFDDVDFDLSTFDVSFLPGEIDDEDDGSETDAPDPTQTPNGDPPTED
jgi:hypothetical protein